MPIPPMSLAKVLPIPISHTEFKPNEERKGKRKTHPPRMRILHHRTSAPHQPITPTTRRTARARTAFIPKHISLSLTRHRSHSHTHTTFHTHIPSSCSSSRGRKQLSTIINQLTITRIPRPRAHAAHRRRRVRASLPDAAVAETGTACFAGG